MRVALPILLLFPLASPAAAGEIHVPRDYPTIQQAIQAAVSGDEIVVAPGVYPDFLDLLTKDLVLRTSGGPAVTFLEPGIPGSYTPVVTVTGGQTSATRIEGFTFRYSNGAITANNASPVIYGNVFEDNGLFCISMTGATNVQIENNTFRTTAIDTLAIHLVDCVGEVAFNAVSNHPRGCISLTGASTVHVHHNVFKDSGNYGGWAPAMFLYTAAGSVCQIERNAFLRNHGPAIEAGNAGGQVDAVIRNNQFIENDYGPFASVLAAGSNTGTIVFESNYCRGPALTSAYVSSFIRSDYGNLELRNNVFSRLQDTDPWLWTFALSLHVGQTVVEHNLFHEVESSMVTSNYVLGLGSILWDLSITWQQWGIFGDFDYTDVGPVPYGTAGHIMNLDPMFVDAANGDFHLLAGSPCIDSPDGGTAVTHDLDGHPRDAAPDLGPFEYTGASHWFRGTGEAGTSMTLVVQGQPGDAVIFGHSRGLRFSPLNTVYGELWLDVPYTKINLNPIGANGILEVAFTAPPSDVPVLYYTQALIGSTLSPVQELLLGG